MASPGPGARTVKNLFVMPPYRGRGGAFIVLVGGIPAT